MRCLLLLVLRPLVLHVLGPDGALTHICLPSTPQQYGAQEEGVVLRWTLAREEHILRVLPTASWNQASPVLRRWVAKGDAVHPVEQQHGAIVGVICGDLDQEGHERDELQGLWVVGEDGESPKVLDLQKVLLAGLRTDRIGEGRSIRLGKVRTLPVNRFLPRPPSIGHGLLSFELEHPISMCSHFVGEVREKVDLEVDQRCLAVGQRTPKEL
mmetsp:Transcript_105597/g.330875  ORF Transcript_105597/g.330875 Transcript_105597/m.330875 type:complete len:212 (+) Transcript_105597:1394-2029(+)